MHGRLEGTALPWGHSSVGWSSINTSPCTSCREDTETLFLQPGFRSWILGLEVSYGPNGHEQPDLTLCTPKGTGRCRRARL